MPQDNRHHLTQHAYAVVLAGGRGSRLHELTDWRAKPAVPFAGQLKIVDFALSNCVNSGLRHIGVLTQYKAQSLIRHIERGWGFLAATLGEYVDIVPAQQQHGARWYTGTANAVWQNVDVLLETRPEHVLVLGGDHVYKMDYTVMLQEHVEQGVAVSIACVEVPLEDASAMGVITVDDDDRVSAFDEKPACPIPIPGQPTHALVSMGIYVFDIDLLVELLRDDADDANSTHDFGKDILPSLIGRYPVHAHRFASSCVNTVDDRPYWRDVGTVDAYWEANIELTKVVPDLNLYDDDWPILSLQSQMPPAKFVFDETGRRGQALNSLVSSGCIVSGATVRHSILFTKVRVDEGAQVEDSVVLPGATIGHDAKLWRVVIDKYCKLPARFEAGLDPAADRARGFRVTDQGVTLVTPEMIGQHIRAAKLSHEGE